MRKKNRLTGMIAVLFLFLSLPGIQAQAAETERQITEAFSTDSIVYGDSAGITRGAWLHDLSVMFDMSVEEEEIHHLSWMQC